MRASALGSPVSVYLTNTDTTAVASRLHGDCGQALRKDFHLASIPEANGDRVSVHCVLVSCLTILIVAQQWPLQRETNAPYEGMAADLTECIPQVDVLFTVYRAQSVLLPHRSSPLLNVYGASSRTNVPCKQWRQPCVRQVNEDSDPFTRLHGWSGLTQDAASGENWRIKSTC